jgi:hypothetical protein
MTAQSIERLWLKNHQSGRQLKRLLSSTADRQIAVEVCSGQRNDNRARRVLAVKLNDRGMAAPGM